MLALGVCGARGSGATLTIGSLSQVSPEQRQIAGTRWSSRARSAGRRTAAGRLCGCMYCAMLRPSEAVSLRRDDCSLPATGWGLAGADDPHWKAPEVSSAVDRRRVASPAQMEKLIATNWHCRRDAGATAHGAVRVLVLRDAPSIGGGPCTQTSAPCLSRAGESWSSARSRRLLAGTGLMAARCTNPASRKAGRGMRSGEFRSPRS